MIIAMKAIYAKAYFQARMSNKNICVIFVIGSIDVIEIMLVTLQLVQRNKVQREVNQQIKLRSRQNRDSF